MRRRKEEGAKSTQFLQAGLSLSNALDQSNPGSRKADLEHVDCSRAIVSQLTIILAAGKKTLNIVVSRFAYELRSGLPHPLEMPS